MLALNNPWGLHGRISVLFIDIRLTHIPYSIIRRLYSFASSPSSLPSDKTSLSRLQDPPNRTLLTASDRQRASNIFAFLTGVQIELIRISGPVELTRGSWTVDYKSNNIHCCKHKSGCWIGVLESCSVRVYLFEICSRVRKPGCEVVLVLL